MTEMLPTTYPHLLPPNSVPLERTIAGPTGRIDHAIPVPIDTLLRAMEAPEGYLPWLAWHMSLDLWYWEWEEDKRREVISFAVELNRKKGTPYGIRLALQLLGYDLLQYITPPGGFYASPHFTKEEMDAWFRLMPQIRIKLSTHEGYGDDELFAMPKDRIAMPNNPPPEGWDPGRELGWDGIVGLTFVGLNDGEALHGRRAVLRHADGTEELLRLVERVETTENKTAVRIGTISTEGQGGRNGTETGWWASPDKAPLAEGEQGTDGIGFLGDNAFVCYEEVKPKLYTYRIETQYEHQQSEFHLNYLIPGLEPLDTRYERDSDIGDAGAGMHVDDMFAIPLSPPPIGYLLDNFPGPTLAFALRGLDIDYAGPIITLRRPSDGVLKEIGLTSLRHLDVAAIEEFLGPEDGFITRVFNQGTLAGYDLTQDDPELQPRYVDQGAFGKPSMDFFGGKCLTLEISSHQIYGGDDVTIAAVLEVDQFSGAVEDPVLFSWTDGDDYLLQYIPYYLETFGVFDNGSTMLPSTTRINPELPDGWVAGPHVVQAYRDGDGHQGIMSDGKLVEQVYGGRTDTIADVPGVLTVGNSSPDGEQPFNCLLSELVFWPAYEDEANRLAAHAQINAHYVSTKTVPEGADPDNAFVENDKWAAEALADRIYLYDPTVAAPLMQGFSFVGVDRVSIPPFHSDMLVDLHTSDQLNAWYIEEAFADHAFATPEDLTHFHRACRAITVMKALRDKVAVSFGVTEPLTFRDLVHTTEETRFADQVRTVL